MYASSVAFFRFIIDGTPERCGYWFNWGTGELETFSFYRFKLDYTTQYVMYTPLGKISFVCRLTIYGSVRLRSLKSTGAKLHPQIDRSKSFCLTFAIMRRTSTLARRLCNRKQLNRRNALAIYSLFLNAKSFFIPKNLCYTNTF